MQQQGDGHAGAAREVLRGAADPVREAGRAPREPHPDRGAGQRHAGAEGQGHARRPRRCWRRRRNRPQAFAELAKKNSEDPGSAAEGGDLGFFPRGKMVKPFDDAVFGMKVGDIAGPVETQFGYPRHQARRRSRLRRRRSSKRSRHRSKRNCARRRRASASPKPPRASATWSTSSPTACKPAVETFKLELQTSGWVTRQGGADNPLLNNEKFLRALFSDDVLKQQAATPRRSRSRPNMLVVGPRHRAQAGNAAAASRRCARRSSAD